MKESPFDWNLLLDGGEHTVDMVVCQRLLESTRNTAHKQAAQRGLKVRTWSADGRFLTIKALDSRGTYP